MPPTDNTFNVDEYKFESRALFDVGISCAIDSSALREKVL
jgi:hypothetical protein